MSIYECIVRTSFMQAYIQRRIKYFIKLTSLLWAAHRAMLAARCEYFRAMFKPGGMIESTQAGGVIEVPNHSPAIFSLMLEYIYSNSIKKLFAHSSDDMIALMSLANEYLIDDLKAVSVQAATKLLNDDNIGKFIKFCEATGTPDLKESCNIYLRRNMGKNTAIMSCLVYVFIILFEMNVLSSQHHSNGTRSCAPR